MLGINCKVCNSQLLSTTIYAERKKLTVGDFCPSCLTFFRFTDNFNKFRHEVIKNQKEAKLKPKFLTKKRKCCPYCLEKGKENRSKWKIRKMPNKKGKTKHWKCTCQICGGVWTANNGDEHWHYPHGYKSYEQLGL